MEDENIFAILYFPFYTMREKKVALWRIIFVNLHGTLVVCHHFLDFVPTFVGVNFWCVYHILQYALCPRCKAILVGEGVDHLILFVHIHGSINLCKH